MFKDFEVSSYRKSYHVYFNSIWSELPKIIKPGDIFIIDKNILKLYPKISKIINGFNVLEIEANEYSKSYDFIGNLLNELISKGISKNNRLIAIGGGVTQDITAFSSSILFRGIDWIFFPTNLLTQCDSCIGSKSSVNLGKFKNQLGGFWPPREIYIDFAFCSTLSSKEICSGLGEMLHYFLVEGKKSTDLKVLNETIANAKTQPELLYQLINDSLSIKKKMIEIDEFDQGPRNVFNYGHSFGHAIEAVTDFQIPHGIAVSYGMDLANLISVDKGLIDIKLRNEIRNILNHVWLDCPLPEINITHYFDALSKDKKNIGKDIKVILTKGLGKMFKTTLSNDETSKKFISNYFVEKLYEKSL